MLLYVIQSKDPDSFIWTNWSDTSNIKDTFKTICMEYPDHDVRLVSAVENPDFKNLNYQEFEQNLDKQYIVYEVINYRPARR